MKYPIINWPASPQKPLLAHDEIHLWVANLDLPDIEIGNFFNTLSIDEAERAKRFVHEKDRKHFIVGRGILRNILGKYQNINPDKLIFSYAEKGKPELIVAQNNQNLQFNISHSNGIALFAITIIGDVGVDLEYCKQRIDTLSIAKRFFAQEEVAELMKLPKDQQIKGFYNIWTCKEAFIKALGAGLFQQLDQFVVNVVIDSPAQLLSWQDNPTEVKEWSLFNLDLIPEFAAAIAIKSKHVKLQKWCWCY